MEFIWPGMLFSLVVIPLAIFGYVLLQRRRKRLASQFGSLGFGVGPARPGRDLQRHLPTAILLVGLTVLLAALGRPQTVVSMPRVEGTVILAFDVSGSMAADDFQPTRMEAAKAAARSFIEKQPREILIGVVAFSDTGFSVQAPTYERDAVLAAIDRLAPQRGTSLARGMYACLNVIAAGRSSGPLEYSNRTPVPTPSPTPVAAGTYTNASIVLLSDGENNENPDPMEAAQAAVDRGVRIYTIGVGSPSGANLKIDGFTIHTSLDESQLQHIAQFTNGAYFNAQTPQDLQTIYTTIQPQLVVKPEKTEVTALFTGASLVLLLVGGISSLLWFGRLP
jgi:Ca-activated chloride channel family protein